MKFFEKNFSLKLFLKKFIKFFPFRSQLVGNIVWMEHKETGQEEDNENTTTNDNYKRNNSSSSGNNDKKKKRRVTNMLVEAGAEVQLHVYAWEPQCFKLTALREGHTVMFKHLAVQSQRPNQQQGDVDYLLLFNKTSQMDILFGKKIF